MLILREGFRTVRRVPLVWVMFVITLGVSLSITAMLVQLSMHAHSELRKLLSQSKIEAFFDPSVSSSDAEKLVQEKISGAAGFSNMSFTSKEAALEKYSAASGEDVRGVLGMNPLPASVRVSPSEATVANFRNAMKVLSGMTGIAHVAADDELVDLLEKRSVTMRKLSIYLGGMLLLSAFCFALTVLRMSIVSRRETLNAMRLLGASRLDLAGPFIVESTAGGAVGGLIAIGLFLPLDRLANTILLPGAPAAWLNPSLTLPMMLTAAAGITIGLLSGLVSAPQSLRSR